MKMYKIDWVEFDLRCRNLAKLIKKNKNIKNLYGIPRGGLPAAVRISHLTNLPLVQFPSYSKTAIIDDIIDSGATRDAFKDFKYFFVVVDKQKENIKEWVEFYYEVKK